MGGELFVCDEVDVTEDLRCLMVLCRIALQEYGYGLVLVCIHGYDIQRIAVVGSDLIFIDSFAWYLILIPNASPAQAGWGCPFPSAFHASNAEQKMRYDIQSSAARFG